MHPTPSLRSKLRASLSKASAKLRKKPPITPEQKLQARIDTLNAQAQDLHAECSRLQAEATTFVQRAETTKAPEAPPEPASPLFQREGPSQYDAQVSAYRKLEKEFASFEGQVEGFGRRLEKFETVVGNLKKGNVEDGKAMGKVEHQFEGLDNAVFNLRKQRVELSQAVSAVPLPGMAK